MSVDHKEERRDGYIEMPHTFVEKINKHMDREEGVMLGMKIVGSIFAVLIAVLVWVLIEKNNDIKAVQQTIVQHTVQNAEMIQIVKGIIETNARQQTEIDTVAGVTWGRKLKER